MASAKRLPQGELRFGPTAEPAPGPTNPALVSVAFDGDVDGRSPVHVMHEALAAEFVDHTLPRAWSKRGTLLFVAGVCGAFWAATGWGVSLLMR